MLQVVIDVLPQRIDGGAGHHGRPGCASGGKADPTLDIIQEAAIVFGRDRVHDGAQIPSRRARSVVLRTTCIPQSTVATDLEGSMVDRSPPQLEPLTGSPRVDATGDMQAAPYGGAGGMPRIYFGEMVLFKQLAE